MKMMLNRKMKTETEDLASKERKDIERRHGRSQSFPPKKRLMSMRQPTSRTAIGASIADEDKDEPTHTDRRTTNNDDKTRRRP